MAKSTKLKELRSISMDSYLPNLLAKSGARYFAETKLKPDRPGEARPVRLFIRCADLIYLALDLPVDPVDFSVDPLGIPLDPVALSPDLVDELRVTPNAAAVFSSTVPVKVRLLAF